MKQKLLMLIEGIDDEILIEYLYIYINELINIKGQD